MPAPLIHITSTFCLLAGIAACQVPPPESAPPPPLKAQPLPHKAQSSVKAPPLPPESEPLAGWRADVRTFAEEVPRRHKNVFYMLSRERFEAAVGALEAKLPGMERHEVVVEIARIVAMMGDGHSTVNWAKSGVRFYPIKYYFFSDGLYVIAADPAYADAVGGRVVSLGNLSADDAFRRVAEVVSSDNEMQSKWLTPTGLVLAEVLGALRVVGDMQRVPLTVERDGRRITVELRPAKDIVPGQFERSLSIPRGWVDARKDAKHPAPLWLKDPQNNFWSEPLSKERTLYVQYNAVQNKSDETIAAFFGRVLRELEKGPFDRLVIDARLNGGGNNTLNRPIWHGVLRSNKLDQRGRLFVLIGRNTFSAAQNFVNQMSLNTRAVFIGEPTGGRPNHFGDNAPLALPHLGMEVKLSTLWQDRDPRDERPWHPPDVAVELSFADYRDNVDPVMRAVLEYKEPAPIAEQVRDAIARGDRAFAERALMSWKAEPKNKYASVVDALNQLGYELLGKQKIDQATQVFELNTKAYPQASNPWDSLGEAYMVQGKTALAIESYEKSLKLNPKNHNALRMLARLRGQPPGKP